MNTRPLQAAIAILPVLSAALYLLGLSYQQGYLHAYGVDDSLLPLPSDRIFFTGFLALAQTSLSGMLYAIGMLLLFVVAALAAAILSSRTDVRAWWSKVVQRFSWRPQHPPSSTAVSLLDRSALVYGYVTSLSLLLLALLLVATWSSSFGTRQAEREIKRHAASGSATATIEYGQDQTLAGASIIVCSERACAFWTGKESLVVRQDAIKSLRLLLPQARTNTGEQKAPASSSAR